MNEDPPLKDLGLEKLKVLKEERELTPSTVKEEREVVITSMVKRIRETREQKPPQQKPPIDQTGQTEE